MKNYINTDNQYINEVNVSDMTGMSFWIVTAAMLAATERTIASLDKEKVSFWWLITSDEEGEAEWGSKWIAEYLASKNVQLDMCLVGEPSA